MQPIRTAQAILCLSYDVLLFGSSARGPVLGVPIRAFPCSAEASPGPSFIQVGPARNSGSGEPGPAAADDDRGGRCVAAAEMMMREPGGDAFHPVAEDPCGRGGTTVRRVTANSWRQALTRWWSCPDAPFVRRRSLQDLDKRPSEWP